ncbi:hypothetical protein BLNAU_4003 [Blattamonas nauphoetae]|uniref:Uncharacterized protein n=1 Tax=Blattamonas nauphoetae TaxID=2049346 RepID=A0ABQ9YAX5_9EUKA|nr:hypothetical protein BLNAU_4003 [Blattamonas nauphoetae]
MDSTLTDVLVTSEHHTHPTTPSEVINLIDEGLGLEHEDELNPISVDTSTPPSQTELTISKVKRQQSTATSGSEDASSSGENQVDLPRFFQGILKKTLPNIIHEMSSMADTAILDYHTLQKSVIQLQSEHETSNQTILVQQERIHELNNKLEATNSNFESLKNEIEEARARVEQFQDQIDAVQSSHENQISSLSSQLSQISNELQKQELEEPMQSTLSSIRKVSEEENQLIQQLNDQNQKQNELIAELTRAEAKKKTIDHINATNARVLEYLRSKRRAQ